MAKFTLDHRFMIFAPTKDIANFCKRINPFCINNQPLVIHEMVRQTECPQCKKGLKFMGCFPLLMIMGGQKYRYCCAKGGCESCYGKKVQKHIHALRPYATIRFSDPVGDIRLGLPAGSFISPDCVHKHEQKKIHKG